MLFDYMKLIDIIKLLHCILPRDQTFLKPC